MGTEFEVFAGEAAEVDADDGVLVAGGALRFVNMEAVAENGHFKEDELVLQRVEVVFLVQVLIEAVCLLTKVLSQMSKSWQVMHWKRMPQMGSMPQWLQEMYSCLMFSSTSVAS